MGRKKIKIQPIVEEKVRIITFNKRKAGLLKKAAELAMLCNIKLYLTFTDINGNIIKYYGPNKENVKYLLQNTLGSSNKNTIEFNKEDYPEFFKVKRTNSKQNLKQEGHDESHDQGQNSEKLEDENQEYYEENEEEEFQDMNQQEDFDQYNNFHNQDHQNGDQQQISHQNDNDQNSKHNNNNIENNNLDQQLKNAFKKKKLTIDIPKQNKNLEVEMKFIKLLNTINKTNQKKTVNPKEQNQQQQLLDFAVPLPVQTMQDFVSGIAASGQVPIGQVIAIEQAQKPYSGNQNIQQLQFQKNSNPDSFDNFLMMGFQQNQSFSQLQFPHPFLNSFTNNKSGNQLPLNSYTKNFDSKSPQNQIDLIGGYYPANFTHDSGIISNQLSSSDSSNQFISIENFPNSQLQKLLISPQNYTKQQNSASQVFNENFLGGLSAVMPSIFEQQQLQWLQQQQILQSNLNNNNNNIAQQNEEQNQVKKEVKKEEEDEQQQQQQQLQQQIKENDEVYDNLVSQNNNNDNNFQVLKQSKKIQKPSNQQQKQQIQKNNDNEYIENKKQSTERSPTKKGKSIILQKDASIEKQLVSNQMNHHNQLEQQQKKQNIIA